MAHLYAILGGVAVLLVLSVIAGKTAVRLGVPTLLLFLALGMAAGSEGIGGLWFDYPRIAQGVGVVPSCTSSMRQDLTPTPENRGGRCGLPSVSPRLVFS